MRIRLVCYEDTESWILGKFALKLQEELRLLSVDADIARTPDATADVNHHIIYLDYNSRPNPLDTVMVTHIDADWKFRKLKRVMEHASVGICMSADTMGILVAAGIPAAKLCFINPAHDGAIRPRPLLVGITTRVYPDGRKRERLLLELAERISPSSFAFMIMGEGWGEMVALLRAQGYCIDYRPDFDLDTYRKLIPTLDYYLYLGLDEGSMGFIDALSAGVPTIVTPQGYHLDAAGGLVHPFETLEELCAVFERIAAARQALVDSVACWTWRDYAVKHLALWKYLLTGERSQELYPDGLTSLGRGREGTNLRGRMTERFKFLRGSIRGIRSSFSPVVK
jgi:hypothetical protein